jgi:putative heme iron utilization protein
MTYAFTNPTAADLVDTVEEWPGVTTLVHSSDVFVRTAVAPRSRSSSDRVSIRPSPAA